MSRSEPDFVDDQKIGVSDPMHREALHNLTTLRFVAAFSVFLHHLDTLGVNMSAPSWGLNLGWTVSFFYVLSGFVLGYSYDGRIRSRRDTMSFIVLRIVRLWPLHVVCALLYVLLLGFGTTTFLQAYLFLTLQQAWVPSYGTAFALNSVAWSISVELFFYLVFPFLIVRSFRKLILMFVASLLVLFASVGVLSSLGAPVFPDFAMDPFWFRSTEVTPSSFLLLFPIMRLPEFLSGILVYRVFACRRFHPALVGATQMATLVVIVLYMSVHADIVGFIGVSVSDAASQAYRQYGMFPLFAWTVFVFAHGRGTISGLMSHPVPVYLGQISFSFYMVHQIVIRWLAAFSLPEIAGAGVAVAVALVCSIAMAGALHHSVERPTMRWAKRHVLQMQSTVRELPSLTKLRQP